MSDTQVQIFENMIGVIMSSVSGAAGDGEMVFTSNQGKTFTFTHHQDCCESVLIDDIEGDLSWLVGYPIVQAEEVSSPEFDGDSDSGTWTFYKFSTVRGSVTVKWLGTSNGYYSESVDYEES